MALLVAVNIRMLIAKTDSGQFYDFQTTVASSENALTGQNCGKAPPPIPFSFYGLQELINPLTARYYRKKMGA